MELPGPEWRYRAASEDWPPHTYPSPGAAYTDNFERPSENFPAIDVSTQELPSDQTPDQFMADLDAGTADIGCEAASTEDVTVDGVVGRYQVQVCAGGFESIVEVIVFDGNRVYAIYWVGLAEDAASDEPVFRQIVSTFRFSTTDY